jgi:PAS domain-containing protein
MPHRINIDYNSLNSLVMQAPISFILLEGENLVIKVINERALYYTGRTYEDVIDKPFFEAFREFKSEGYPAIFKNIMITGETYTANEIPVHLLNWSEDESRYVNLILKPHILNGKTTGIIGVASDVTELVKSKKASRESEDKFRAIFDTMNQGLAIVEMEYDKHGKAVDYKFIEINSTPFNPASIILLTALFPPPPTPTTLIWAP